MPFRCSQSGGKEKILQFYNLVFSFTRSFEWVRSIFTSDSLPYQESTDHHLKYHIEKESSLKL